MKFQHIKDKIKILKLTKRVEIRLTCRFLTPHLKEEGNRDYLMCKSKDPLNLSFCAQPKACMSEVEGKTYSDPKSLPFAGPFQEELLEDVRDG